MPTLSSFALVVVAVCLLSSLTPRLPLQRIWRAEGEHCFVLGVLEAWCQELILAPSKQPDPFFLLFSHCSLNPSQVCGLWWWVTRLRRVWTASLGAWAGPSQLSFPSNASTIARQIAFQITELSTCWSEPLDCGLPEARDLPNSALTLSTSYSARLPPSGIEQYLFGN